MREIARTYEMIRRKMGWYRGKKDKYESGKR